MRSRRTPERDYSHRTLFDKLSVTENSRVALLGRHDDAFVTGLKALLATPVSTRLNGAFDLIFLRVDAPRDLARIASAAKHLVPNGGFWVLHPKGRGASPSDSEVRAAGLAAGLVDNKISAYSDTHTSTRYVIPRDRRPER
jgi:hypothetical protein